MIFKNGLLRLLLQGIIFLFVVRQVQGKHSAVNLLCLISIPKERKQFRSIAHHLKPIVTVADKGLTANVVAELSRALQDHELIKVKVV